MGFNDGIDASAFIAMRCCEPRLMSESNVSSQSFALKSVATLTTHRTACFASWTDDVLDVRPLSRRRERLLDAFERAREPLILTFTA